jgi:hypothetical protein
VDIGRRAFLPPDCLFIVLIVCTRLPFGANRSLFICLIDYDPIALPLNIVGAAECRGLRIIHSSEPLLGCFKDGTHFLKKNQEL